jgi:ABC-type nickel/cobalt efflux system permease component RcnA
MQKGEGAGIVAVVLALIALLGVMWGSAAYDWDAPWGIGLVVALFLIVGSYEQWWGWFDHAHHHPHGEPWNHYHRGGDGYHDHGAKGHFHEDGHGKLLRHVHGLERRDHAVPPEDGEVWDPDVYRGPYSWS